MAHVITFRTAKFDITKETPNPINPIAGESVLQWLGEKLEAGGYKADPPGTEDWGWYIGVDWTIQIHRQRSFKDKITGANKMTAEDPLSATIEKLLRAEAGISAIDVDKE